MDRRVKSKHYGGLEGIAHQVRGEYTWVTFYEGRLADWVPNNDLTEVKPEGPETS
jgi:hypothetical protein